MLRTSCLLLAITAASAVVAQEEKLVSGLNMDYVSPNLQPGDDFYTYANEGWLNVTEIPADQSNWGSFSVIDDEVKKNIRAIIDEAAASNAPEGSEAQKVG
ncbi:MAG: peptidase M13, partial [Planctomycetota bacterium]